MKSVAWVSSWDRVCGVADYSKTLFPAVKTEADRQYDFRLLSLDEFRDSGSLATEISRLKPAIVHFQHEYGLYGGKNPPRYWFPKLVSDIRERNPETRLIATAHTVLAESYRFPVKLGGFQAIVRSGANALLLPILRTYWGPKTWGALNGVVVHSSLQIATIRNFSRGIPAVVEIPHFVGQAGNGTQWKPRQEETGPATVLVFGFITPEKGQDVAIQSLSKIDRPIQLILAGGVRRNEDQAYYDSLLRLISERKLGERVTITGFVPNEQVDHYFQNADLVLVPFRETSGSGSLAQALSRGAPILASDLPLNCEISNRVPGALAYFRSEDPEDCAKAIARLLDSSEERMRLSRAAREYAERYSPQKIARLHLGLYNSLLRGERA